jgi:hypothetical protein
MGWGSNNYIPAGLRVTEASVASVAAGSIVDQR